MSDLFEMLKTGAVHESWLRAVEQKDNIFPQLDYRVHRSDYDPSPAAESSDGGA